MELPSVIEHYWYAFDWDVEALWALDLATERMPIGQLEWHLDVPVWPSGEHHYALTPREVVRAPYRYEREYQRTRSANLLFPIEVTWFRRRWLILDGVHRLLKAHEDGVEEMLVRKVPVEMFSRNS